MEKGRETCWTWHFNNIKGRQRLVLEMKAEINIRKNTTKIFTDGDGKTCPCFKKNERKSKVSPIEDTIEEKVVSPSEESISENHCGRKGKIANINKK